MNARRDDLPEGLTELAARIEQLSHARWGAKRPTSLVGLHPRMIEAQHRMLMCAQADSPVLISGETGTGKELFARAMHLLSRRRAASYLCVNCAQYQDGQLIASELFGHRKGSFTGAVSEHRGIFEEADGGIVFLDEIAELSPVAQAMLLRTLSEGEILPVGDSRPRAVDVRVFAATSRELKDEVARGRFREDLFYRLRYLSVRVPALRERGGDCVMIATRLLQSLATNGAKAKELTAAAAHLLRTHQWPGNIRELRSVIETAFHVSTGAIIDAGDLEEELRGASYDALPVTTPPNGQPAVALRGLTSSGEWESRSRDADRVQEIYRAMVADRRSFWALVHGPFMARDLTRADARAIVEHGLFEARGSYKRLLVMFGIATTDYLRFMDFLRHHRLKPSRATDMPTDATLPLSTGGSDWGDPQRGAD